MKLHEIFDRKTRFFLTLTGIWLFKFEPQLKSYTFDPIKMAYVLLLTITLPIAYGYVGYKIFEYFGNIGVEGATIVLSFSTWILPLCLIEILRFRHEKKILNFMKNVKMTYVTPKIVEKIQRQNVYALISASLYYGPVMLSFHYHQRFKGGFGKVLVVYQYFTPIFYHFVSLFLVFHNFYYNSFAICLSEETKAITKVLKRKNYVSGKKLWKFMSEINQSFWLSQKITKYFFLTALVKIIHIVLDLVTEVYPIFCGSVQMKSVQELIFTEIYYALTDFPIFIVFCLSQSRTNAFLQVSWT